MPFVDALSDWRVAIYQAVDTWSQSPEAVALHHGVTAALEQAGLLLLLLPLLGLILYRLRGGSALPKPPLSERFA